jgi:Ca2+-binding EF-hand superfamily protein
MNKQDNSIQQKEFNEFIRAIGSEIEKAILQEISLTCVNLQDNIH